MISMFSDGEKFFEKTDFTVTNSFLFLYPSKFGFDYSGVGQQFEYSIPFGLAGFWHFLLQTLKSNRGLDSFSFN